MGTFLTRHLQNALAALGQLSRQPVATLLTVGVIGIALALPASLQLLVQGGQRFAGGWSGIRDFSVYLKPGTDLAVARNLTRALAGHPGVQDTRLIEADDGAGRVPASSPAFGEALEGARRTTRCRIRC
jgi:cell division transport system permease protein